MKKKFAQNQSVDFAIVEKWLENYFLDPLTAFYDQTQFQIDLFETETEWILEAILSDFDSSEIKVYIEEKTLLITAAKHPSTNKAYKKVRSIEFPFLVTKQEISAVFINGNLEISISKTEKGSGRDRYITLN